MTIPTQGEDLDGREAIARVVDPLGWQLFDEVRAIPCDSAVADWLEAELIRTLQPTENVKRFAQRARRVVAALAEMVE